MSFKITHDMIKIIVFASLTPGGGRVRKRTGAKCSRIMVVIRSIRCSKHLLPYISSWKYPCFVLQPKLLFAFNWYKCRHSYKSFDSIWAKKLLSQHTFFSLTIGLKFFFRSDYTLLYVLNLRVIKTWIHLH